MSKAVFDQQDCRALTFALAGLSYIKSSFNLLTELVDVRRMSADMRYASSSSARAEQRTAGLQRSRISQDSTMISDTADASQRIQRVKSRLRTKPSLVRSFLIRCDNEVTDPSKSVLTMLKK